MKRSGVSRSARPGSLLILATLALLAGQVTLGQSRSTQAREELGRRLLDETEFSNPGRDFAAACQTCHFRGTDPRDGGDRLYADSSSRSLMPSGVGKARETTLRNTPPLVDLARRSSYGYDGRWKTLEEAIGDELVSRHLGWLPEERERALDQVHRALLDPAMTDYADLFARAYQVDLSRLDRDEAVALAVRALADHLREIGSTQTSRWDAFAEMNRIPTGPGRDEEPKHYAGRIYGRLTNQEGRVLIKRPLGFSPEAYQGFKTFFRVEGGESVGNCVSCHVPPRFEDGGFHATGVSRAEYEAEHGSGSWERLDVPGPRAPRPVARLLAKPQAGEGYADLGHWNYVDLGSSPQRLEGESDAGLLRRMRGAFRTATLRNLGRTGPYMHDGSSASLQEAVRSIVAFSRSARDGALPGIDGEYASMRLDESDVVPLAAFLATLDDLDELEFRELLISIEAEPDDRE